MDQRKYSPEKRQIRVFISSAFEDMKAERDILVDVIFAKLQDKARQRAVAVTALDLRWGIPKGTDLGRTIEICMNEIDDSYPFFIGIVGKYYGDPPGKAEVFDPNDVLREQFSILSKYFEKELSITDMEMRYGVLDREEEERRQINALFLTRERDLGFINQDPKLSALNKDILDRSEDYDETKITRDEKNHIWSSTYSSVVEFGKIVEKVFDNLLDKLFPVNESLDVYQRQRFMQDAVVADLSRFYIPTDSTTAITNFIDSPTKRKLLITGGSGYGKSSLLADWIHNYESVYRTKGYDFIYHFIGSGESEIKSSDVEHRLLHELCTTLGVSPDNEFKKKSLYGLLSLGRLRDTRNVVIIIDAVNQLQDGRDLRWLSLGSLPKDVKLIISTLSGDSTEGIIKSAEPDEVITVRGLSEEKDRREAIIRYVKEFHGRDLGENLDKVVNWSLSRNPLALKTLLNELVVAGRYDMMDSMVDGYVSCPSIESMFDRIFSRLSGNEKFSWVGDVLASIALSRYGLSEDEILKIFPIHKLYWSGFYCSFKRHFFIRNGLITFSHQYVRKAVERTFIADEEKRNHIHSQLIRFFEDVHSARAQEELMHHYYALGDYHSVYLLASDPESFINLWDNDSLNLISFWEVLLTQGYSPEGLILTYDQWSELDYRIYENKGVGFGNGYSDYCAALQRLLISLNLHDLSMKMFQVLQQHVENAGTFGLEHSRMYRIIAESHERVGELEKAIDMYKLSFWDVNSYGFNEKEHLVDPMYTDVYTSIASCYRRLGHYNKARKFLDYAKESVDLSEKEQERQAAFVTYLLEEVAFCLDTGRYDDADAALNLTHRASAARFTDQAEIAYHCGDYCKTITCLHDYLKYIAGDSQEYTGVDAAIAYREIAKALIELDKATIAEQFIEASFRRIEGRGEDVAYLKAKNYEQLARIRYFRKDYSAAIEYYLKAADILEGMKLWPEWLSVCRSAAIVTTWEKQTESGLALLQKCYSLIERKGCCTDFQKGEILWAISSLEYFVRDYENSFKHARLAFTIIVEKLGPQRDLSLQIIRRLDSCLKCVPALRSKMAYSSGQALSEWDRYVLLSQGKPVSADVKAYLCCNKLISDPITWRIIVSLSDSFEWETILRIIDSKSVDELFDKIVSCMERDYDKEFLKAVFLSIILSPDGADEHRVLSLSKKIRPGEWESFLQQYGALFRILDGRISLVADVLKGVLISHYFPYDVDGGSLMSFIDETLRFCTDGVTNLEANQYYQRLKNDAEDLNRFIGQTCFLEFYQVHPDVISTAMQAVLRYCTPRDDVFMYLAAMNFHSMLYTYGVEDERTREAAGSLSQCINYGLVQPIIRGHVSLVLGVKAYGYNDYKSALPYLSDYYSLAYDSESFVNQLHWYRAVKDCRNHVESDVFNELTSASLQKDWNWVEHKFMFIDNALLFNFKIDCALEDKENNLIKLELTERPDKINSESSSHEFIFNRHSLETSITIDGKIKVVLHCRRGLWRDLDDGGDVMNLYRIKYPDGVKLKDFETFIKAIFKGRRIATSDRPI